jgi:aspartate racemase
MKTIGLLGGMSWESTVLYYQIINRTVAEQLGGLHSAKIVLHSVDFAQIERLQSAGKWDKAGVLIADLAARLEVAGAEVLVLCTNTMHKIAHVIQDRVRIPLLHIADPTAQAIRHAGLQIVGLLGTRFTMEQDFYRTRLEQEHGLNVLIPTPADIAIVHRVIYEELCVGKISEASRTEYRRIMQALVAQGAQCIILGCTEITLLVGVHDVTVPLFDTTAIHARAAALFALGQSVSIRAVISI